MDSDLTLLLRRLNQNGIELLEKNGRLVVKASKGALTEELRLELSHNKSAILNCLRAAKAAASTLPNLEPVSRKGAFPLSHSQRRWWLMEQLTGNPIINHLPAAWKLFGVLNTKAMKQAFKEIVRRHETLRTTFQYNNAAI